MMTGGDHAITVEMAFVVTSDGEAQVEEMVTGNKE